MHRTLSADGSGARMAAAAPPQRHHRALAAGRAHVAVALEEGALLDHQARREEGGLHACSRRAARCAGGPAPAADRAADGDDAAVDLRVDLPGLADDQRVVGDDLALHACRRCGRCRGSGARPWNSVPSSMKPLMSSAVRPLILIMRPPPTPSTAAARARRRSGAGSGRPRPPRTSTSNRRCSSASLVKAMRSVPPLPRRAICDARAERRAQPLLGRARVGVARAAAARRGRAQRAPPGARPRAPRGRARRLAGRAPPGPRRAPGPAGRARGPRPGARRHQVAHLARQAQQPQGVGDGGAVLAHPAGDLLLGELNSSCSLW